MFQMIEANLDQFQAQISRYLKLDGWTNPVTGAGTSRDRTTYARFIPTTPLTDAELANLYHGDDMAARMVDIIPQEMLREPFEVDTEDDDTNSYLADKFEELDVRSKFTEAMIWGRLFGGCATLLGADDRQSAAKPLDAERAKDVSFLYTIDRRLLQPYSYYRDIGNPKLGKVETYLLSFETPGAPAPGSFSANSAVLIHESRLIMWPGARTAEREKIANNSWDYSVLQRAVDVLKQFNSAWQSAETLLTEANQTILKIAGLSTEVAANGQAAVSARLSMIDMFRSVTRAIVLDAGNAAQGEAEEKFERNAVNFTGIPDMLDKAMLRLAATVRMPVTILMGQSPAGMDATGDSDFRWFYDQIRSDQQNYLTPRIRRLSKVCLATQTAPSSNVAAITVKYAPLWTETPKEEAERRNQIATADKTYIDAKVLRPEQVLLSRFRPEGFNTEINIDEESRKAAEDRLKEFNENGEPEPNEGDDNGGNPMLVAGMPPGSMPPASPTPPQQGQPPETEPAERQDANGTLFLERELTQQREPKEVLSALDVVPYSDITEQLDHPRVILAGVPRSGKTSHAARAGERFGRKVFWESQTFEGTRDEQAVEIARQIDSSGDWILEGCSAVLGLRQWLADNPHKQLDAVVYFFGKPVQKHSKGHERQSKAIHTVWAQIKSELQYRGATVIER